MVKLKSEKRGAEMALNTIVIALLVIIVMVVIIFVFTSNVGKTNDALGEQRELCSLNNPVIIPLGYTEFRKINEDETTGETCLPGEERVAGIPDCCFKK